MKIAIIHLEEMYRLIDERFNPPLVTNQTEENLFQAEIRMSYNQLVESLSEFGDEGDYYGISSYRIQFDQDFDPKLTFTVLLTADLASLVCDDRQEMDRIRGLLAEL